MELGVGRVFDEFPNEEKVLGKRMDIILLQKAAMERY